MTETDNERATRDAYNTIATDYAKRFGTELDARPFDRAMLGAFAELVRDSGLPVADVGSGPGPVTAYLHALGVDVFGVDLSQQMVELARRTHPGLRFEVGSMTTLDIEDGALGGLVASYSIIHIEPERLAGVFTEFHRVLALGGHLLLAFQVGDDILHFDEAFGHTVSVDFRRMRPDRVTDLLRQNGFDVRAQLVREPEESEKVPQAYLLAHR